MTKYVKVSDFFYHVINYSLFTSEPEIDLIFLLNLVNFNLPRDFFRQNSELGEIVGKGSKSCNQGLPRLDPHARNIIENIKLGAHERPMVAPPPNAEKKSRLAHKAGTVRPRGELKSNTKNRKLNWIYKL